MPTEYRIYHDDMYMELTAEHSKYSSPLLAANCLPSSSLTTRRSFKSTLLATKTPTDYEEYII